MNRRGPVVTRDRTIHLSVGNVALVAAGGALGTGLRHGLTMVLPPQFGGPVAIFTVNVVGAFLLGVLLESSAVRGVDPVRSRRLRLGIGTGVLGGFTTYSTLATDEVALALAHPALAAAYGLATLITGAVASLLGVAVSRGRLRPAERTLRRRS